MIFPLVFLMNQYIHNTLHLSLITQFLPVLQSTHAIQFLQLVLQRLHVRLSTREYKKLFISLTLSININE